MAADGSVEADIALIEELCWAEAQSGARWFSARGMRPGIGGVRRCGLRRRISCCRSVRSGACSLDGEPRAADLSDLKPYHIIQALCQVCGHTVRKRLLRAERRPTILHVADQS